MDSDTFLTHPDKLEEQFNQLSSSHVLLEAVALPPQTGFMLLLLRTKLAQC